MTKSWTSEKSKALVEERRTELDLLIDFANADMIASSFRHLQTRVLDHLHRHPALHPANRDWKIDGGLANLIDVLKQHLCSRFETIIENKQMMWEMPLWEISGSVTLVQRPGGLFNQRFQLRKVKPGNEINALKKIMDLWLIEIIRDLDLSAQRFRRCLRCGGFYYSPTAKERTYCSTRCAGAARQEKFRNRKEG